MSTGLLVLGKLLEGGVVLGFQGVQAFNISQHFRGMLSALICKMRKHNLLYINLLCADDLPIKSTYISQKSLRTSQFIANYGSGIPHFSDAFPRFLDYSRAKLGTAEVQLLSTKTKPKKLDFAAGLQAHKGRHVDRCTYR